MSSVEAIETKSILARVGSFIWGAFFLLVFFGGWLAIAFFAGGEGVIDYVRAKTWDENVCDVRSAEMVFQNHGTSATRKQMYQIQTTYTYVVDGKEFYGSRYGLDDRATSEFRRPARAETYLKNNPQVTCYYNPRNPSEAIIDRSFTGNLLIVLFPLTFVVLFGGLMLMNINKKPKPARRARRA